jgi:RNA polymerase sigma factor (sigma-70 family)
MASPASTLSHMDLRHSALSCVAGSALSTSDVDDLIQEAWITVIRVESRYPDTSPSQRKRIARRAVTNRLRDASRLARRRAAREETTDHERLGLLADRASPFSFPSQLPSPLHYIISAELRNEVARALQNIPARLRDVYRTLYEEGMSQKEAAGVLGISQPRVAQLHRRLRDELAPLLVAHWR